MSQRRPKDRSHWGDAAFKAMHSKLEKEKVMEPLLADHTCRPMWPPHGMVDSAPCADCGRLIDLRICLETIANLERISKEENEGKLKAESERDEARAEREASSRDYVRMSARADRLEAEVARLEGLILDWYESPDDNPPSWGALKAEARRIRGEKAMPCHCQPKDGRVCGRCAALAAERGERWNRAT